jgi:hypothetical protein
MKAWFNMGVTKWWFDTVFIPFFTEHFQSEEGTNHGIVILDGRSAHNGIQEWLNDNGHPHIHCIYLPPNVTSMYQPMDQGVLSWLKKNTSTPLSINFSEYMTILFYYKQPS